MNEQTPNINNTPDNTSNVPPIMPEKLDSSDIDNYTPVIKPAPVTETPAMSNQQVTPAPETSPQNQNPEPPQPPKEQIMAAPIPNIENMRKKLHRSEKAKEMVNSSKRKSKLIIILCVLAIIGFFGYKALSASGGLEKILENVVGESKFKIDTGKSWGDAFGTYIKDYYEELSITKMDIAFFDFDNDDTPEMLLRYEDQDGNFPVKIFQINNNQITATKYYFNSQFKMVYSSLNEEIDWYIYIASGKYGAYTKVTKLLENKAKDSDIKATNEKELTEFNKTYLVSDYKINYYECKQNKYLDDFQVAVDRFEETKKDAKDAKTKLEDETANWKQNQQQGEIKTKIIVSDKTLNFGTYVSKVKTIELGQEKYIEKRIVLKENFITVDGKDIKYSVFSNFVTIEDGSKFIVTDNNAFKYGPNEDLYKLEE